MTTETVSSSARVSPQSYHPNVLRLLLPGRLGLDWRPGVW